MTRLRATTTRSDQDRAARLMLAWSYGDKVALDLCLDEVMNDPVGTPGVLFALLDFTTRLGEQVAPDFRERLQAKLLADLDDDAS